MPTHSLFPLKPDAHKKVKLHSRTKCTRKYQYMRLFERTGCSTSFSIFRYTVKFSSSTSNESKTISLLFCLSDLLQGVMRNVIAFRSCLTLDRSFTVWGETSGTLDVFTARHTEPCAVSPSIRTKLRISHIQISCFSLLEESVFFIWQRPCGWQPAGLWQRRQQAPAFWSIGFLIAIFVKTITQI